MSRERPETIEDWRRRIDELNDRILELLSERAECALEVGRLKHSAGQAIHVPERESAVLQRLKSANKGPFSNEAVVRLFRAIIDETLRMEQDDTDKEST